MRFFVRLLLGGCFIIASCANDPVEPPKPPKPAVKEVKNLTLSITIKGKSVSQPYGDGSGVIDVVAKGDNAVKYSFRFGTGEVVENTTGKASYTFKHSGAKQYTVAVVAVSSTGHSLKVSEDITVLKGYQLLWSDEFDTDGAPQSTHWTYDIGWGNNGWGNNEAQYYTKRAKNVVISGGVLKITVMKEAYSGKQYTSARLKTQGKFSFTYGKVEVRAKLPKGVGTWPAIWMLGNNITSVGWPACGEIDIMEHVGKQQNVIHSSLHTPSSYGGTVNTHKKTIASVSEQFHIYTMEWTAEKITFFIDGKQHYQYSPANKTKANYPFNAPQFILLNVAMGGTFGGAIASDFSKSTMEVDYVRVYQYKK